MSHTCNTLQYTTRNKLTKKRQNTLDNWFGSLRASYLLSYILCLDTLMHTTLISPKQQDMPDPTQMSKCLRDQAEYKASWRLKFSKSVWYYYYVTYYKPFLEYGGSRIGFLIDRGGCDYVYYPTRIRISGCSIYIYNRTNQQVIHTSYWILVV